MDKNRRKLIQGAGALAATGAVLSLPSLSFGQMPNPNAVKLQVFGVGDILVLPNVPLPIVSPGSPPQQLEDLLPLLLNDNIRIRVTQQLSTDLSTATVQLVAGSVPSPSPLPFTLPQTDFRLRHRHRSRHPGQQSRKQQA